MFTTVLLLSVLAQSPDVPTEQRQPLPATALTPTRPATGEDVVSFDAMPDPDLRAGDDRRVARFLGSFAAGAGAFAGMMVLGGATATPACMFCGVGAGPIIAALFAPTVSLVASWATFVAMGGKAGFLAPFAALVPALVLAMGMLPIMTAMDPQSLGQHLPVLITTGVLIAGGSSLALHLRQESLGELGAASEWGGASAGRVAVTSLLSGVAVGGAAFLTAGLVAATYSLQTFQPVLAVIAALGQSLGAAAAVWGVHVAMKGKGSFVAALAGMGLAGVAAALATTLYFSSQSFGGSSASTTRSTAGAIAMGEVIGAAGLFLPVIALEMSHTSAVNGKLPKLMMGAAPVREGGLVTAGIQF